MQNKEKEVKVESSIELQGNKSLINADKNQINASITIA